MNIKKSGKNTEELTTNNILIGRKGPDVEPGIVFMPYIIQTTTASISSPLLEAAKQKVIAVNRDRKIDSILEDKEFKEYTLEETEEYKKFSETWFKPIKNTSARYTICHIENKHNKK